MYTNDRHVIKSHKLKHSKVWRNKQTNKKPGTADLLCASFRGTAMREPASWEGKPEGEPGGNADTLHMLSGGVEVGVWEQPILAAMCELL